MSALIDLRGVEFGGLTVLHRAPVHPTRVTMWVCRCAGCGSLVEVESQNLRKGRVRSCGGPTCRGRWPLPDPAEALGDQVQPGSLGTTAALLRASVGDDHATIVDLMRGLDEDDDLVGLVLHLLRLCSTALVKAEGSQVAAQRVVDSLAAYDRAQR